MNAVPGQALDQLKVSDELLSIEMAKASETATIDSLKPEWSRIGLLAQSLLNQLQQREADTVLHQKLQALQTQIALPRASGGAWQCLNVSGLPPLAFDILACIFAVAAEPRIGWQYQEIQSERQSYPTPVLIRQLLALDDDETSQLYHWLGVGGELSRRGLVESIQQHGVGDGLFTPLRPTRTALTALLGWRPGEAAPPGAMRVQTKAHWDELVLAPERKRMLREYLLWLRHHQQVVDDWGGSFTGGPIALFSGPSGTGKTFAAGVIANELGWPLYRVDLAALVSKYIGETEKNLGRLFDAADGRAMVLLFDEVDAVMSRRGEIREARDRYANMEVSYLLARIENHRGPCILTTNLRKQIDPAFFRRFQMVVEFPRPDVNCRARLWQRLLPPLAPLAADVNCQILAQSVNLTGGNIRNAALHAAYLAADEQMPIGLGHIAVAVWRELTKVKPQLKRHDLGALAAALPAGILAHGGQ